MRKDLEKNIKERLKEINISNEGYEIKIVEYNRRDDIIVEFQDKYMAKIHTDYRHFKNGNVKNPYHPKTYGIGYIGEGKYESLKYKDIYDIWRRMLQRCYDPYYLNEHPTYRDCIVCEEWHNFQNFARWWEENYYNIGKGRMHLDKDILIKGNKIYSPETCLIVPHRINELFVKKDENRGEYPIGVCETYNNKNKILIVHCSIKENNKSKIKHLGVFPLDKPFQAFTCYKIFKENYIKQVADEYKDLIPNKVYNALYNYKIEIND